MPCLVGHPLVGLMLSCDEREVDLLGRACIKILLARINLAKMFFDFFRFFILFFNFFFFSFFFFFTFFLFFLLCFSFFLCLFF